MTMLMQAATEAVKNPSGIWVGSGAIGSLCGLVTVLAREHFLTRRRGKNGNGVQPGKGETCHKHGEELIELRTKQDGTDKAIDEMKGHIATIEGDVKTLLQRIPPRE
jgi:hypothetical protein